MMYFFFFFVLRATIILQKKYLIKFCNERLRLDWCLQLLGNGNSSDETIQVDAN